MPAQYPADIYDPRTKENKDGVIYAPEQTTKVFAEDVVGLDLEIVAVETELGLEPKGTKADVATRLDDVDEAIDLKADAPVTYYPGAIYFGDNAQNYDISGTTWVASTNGRPNEASHLETDCILAMKYPYSADYFAIRETSSAPSATEPLTCEFRFSAVSGFNTIKALLRYQGSASHNMVLELYNGTTWDIFMTFGPEATFQLHTAEILVDTNYIITGTVRARFRHLEQGVTSHSLLINYLVIASGGGGSSQNIQTAKQTPSTAVGAISATNVQDALAELDTEKQTKVKSVQSVADAATITPNADTDDIVNITAIAQAFTIANASGSPTDGQRLLIRIKDNATARAISYGTAYVAGGVALPTTTRISKILCILFIYNTMNSLNKWQCVAVADEV